MQKRKPIWENTIFRRLVVTFLFIILPIYLIGIFIYNWGYHAINDGVTRSMTAQVSFYMEKLDSEIQRIRIQQNDLMADENLNDLVFVPDSMSYYEKLKAVKQLQHRLFSIRNSSNYIKDVKVRIPGLNYTITANQGMNLSDNISLDILDLSFISPHTQMVYWQGDFYLTNIYKSTYLKKALYWVEIPLEEGVFGNDLKQFNTFPESMSVIYCSSNDLFFINGAEDTNQVLKDSLKHQLDQSKSGTYRMKFNNKRYYGYYLTSEYLGLTIARFVPEKEVLSPVRSYQVWLWVFLAMSLVIVVLFSLSTYGFIHKPLNILLKSFKKVEEGDLALSIEHHHNDEFRYLYSSFNKMVENIGTLISQAYTQKILAQKAELKQMQAQINPHFLYNTFFILYRIAKAEDYDTVLSFLEQLGSYFKYVTRNAEDEVQLYREMDHARTYANIQALRFSNRITIHFEELPDKHRDMLVPRLIIQPIIENSFKYGLEDKVSDGVLHVRFFQTEDCFSIIVEDNGNGMNREEMQCLRDSLSDKQQAIEVTGMVNIHRRLQLKYGENSGLHLTNSELGGLKVIINIDLTGGKNVQAITGG